MIPATVDGSVLWDGPVFHVGRSPGAAVGPSMRVTLVRDPELGRDAVEAVRASGLGPLLRRCGDELDVPARAALAVRLTTDAELRALNCDFRDVDAPTDVLAFPGDDRFHVGDVAISVPRAMAQASDGAAELRLLAVHGLLHCLGHDHADAAQAAEMTKLTRQLLPDQEIPALVTWEH